ncbi:MAG TPA: SUMF1/EgtB/PvdO family nonheme iron enzyme [Polyangiaceae bacterium]|jgi:hypothetical protein|nr:SUMF1/EgtB/PvdO family nonheme iron enzyme [Polyangiaceae bacterium]
MSRKGSLRVATGAASLAFVACAKLVGITDTPVTRDDSPDASVAGLGGASGAAPSDVTMLLGPGGSGGIGGSAAGGPPAGNAGSGGTTADSSMDAGPVDAGSLGCVEQATRCGAAGRELCSAGAWLPQPCPLSQPACEGDGQCVVRGPALVSVGNYFIHATEVTVSQYGAFLTAKNGDVSGQSEVCSWNQSYWDYDEHPIMEPGNQPIAYVDWCDAAAYCSWAGMRLCGRINGGPIARAEVFEPTLSQWYVACGGPGGGTDPNDNPMCNSSQGFSDIADVATFPGCEGYFPGLFDMAGNVSEWVDGCDDATGAADVCYQMGGNIFDQKSYCDEVYNDTEDAFRRDEKAVASGFRCCSG